MTDLVSDTTFYSHVSTNRNIPSRELEYSQNALKILEWLTLESHSNVSWKQHFQLLSDSCLNKGKYSKIHLRVHIELFHVQQSYIP